MAAVGGAHSHWTSRFAFLMASVGFAVGLGNIWRFPYVTGENGGAAFVLIYLGCAFLIGVPILMAELMLGRRGAAAPPIAMATVARESARSPQWQWVGAMTLLAAYTIEIVYAVLSAGCSGTFSRPSPAGSPGSMPRRPKRSSPRS